MKNTLVINVVSESTLTKLGNHFYLYLSTYLICFIFYFSSSTSVDGKYDTTVNPCCRAVGRSENPGVPVLFGGQNLPPLVEIGLIDLPKTGGAMAPPAPPGTTPLR